MWTICCSKLIHMHRRTTAIHSRSPAHGHTKINMEDVSILALIPRLLHSGNRKLCGKVPRRAWIRKNQAKCFVSLRYHVCKLSIVAVLHFENMLSSAAEQTWQTFLQSVSSCVLVDRTAVAFFEPLLPVVWAKSVSWLLCDWLILTLNPQTH